MKVSRSWCGSVGAVCALILALGSGPFSDAAGKTDPAAGPEWAELFDRDGRTIRLPAGALDAVFVEDRLSGGAAIDLSALRHAADPADSIVRNAEVVAAHDVGNTYVLARTEGVDLVFDVRVERLAGDAETETYVELEFNRDLVSVSSGRRVTSVGDDGQPLPGFELRYPFRGQRSVGDLAVRVNLVGSQVDSVEFKRWESVDGVLGYHALEGIENLADEDCFGLDTFYSICSGLLAGGRPGHISNGDPEQDYSPDSHVDITLNVSRLVQFNPDFTTVLVTTPEDFAFGTFRAFGRFSDPASDEGSTATRRIP